MIKRQIEVTRRRGRRRKKLLDDLKDRRGYCQLKEETLDRTVWRNRFGRDFGPVVWQITDDDDEALDLSFDRLLMMMMMRCPTKGIRNVQISFRLRPLYLCETSHSVSHLRRWRGCWLACRTGTDLFEKKAYIFLAGNRTSIPRFRSQ